MFDAYQVQRALRGHLGEDDALETLARDDATGVFWALTRRELVFVEDMQVRRRVPREALRGDVETTDVGVTVRLHSADGPKAIVGTFRKANRFTKALAELLEGDPR